MTSVERLGHPASNSMYAYPPSQLLVIQRRSYLSREANYASKSAAHNRGREILGEVQGRLGGEVLCGECQFVMESLCKVLIPLESGIQRE